MMSASGAMMSLLPAEFRKLRFQMIADIRSNAAAALGRIWPVPQAAVPALIEALKDEDVNVRFSAADTLGMVGPGARVAVPALIKALQDEESIVRFGAAGALRLIGPVAQAAVPALVEALKDKESIVCATAGGALGRMGPDAIPALIKALQDKEPGVRSAVAGALVQIAKSLQDRGAVDAVGDLRRVQAALGKAVPPWDSPREIAQHVLEASPETIEADMRLSESAEEVRRVVAYLELRRETSIGKTMRLVGDHPRWAATLGLLGVYFVWFVLLRFAILPLRPLWVLLWCERLARLDYKLPGWLGEATVPFRNLLVVGFYHYHPRVLDHWVARRIVEYRHRFLLQPTCRERELFIPLPVELNGGSLVELTAASLQPVCSRKRWAVLIRGEGGLGKTTLACQLALWAMADEPENRLCRDCRSLPVLLEPGLGLGVSQDMAVFKTQVRGQLQVLLGEEEPVPEGLFDSLLKTRRILLIVDGLSEMGSTIRAESADFPVMALLVTSRSAQRLPQDATIIPSRIDNEHLMLFLNAYLRQAGSPALEDTELFDACRRLVGMIADGRSVTPLLAKLYAGLVSAAADKQMLNQLPRSVPDLMLSYLNNLNRGRQANDPDDLTVHQAAKVAAWECVRKAFGPGQAEKRDLKEMLQKEKLSEGLLDDMEGRLRIIRTLDPGYRVQFLLDPLSEYLAALRVMDLYRDSDEKWRGFLEEADSKPNAPNAIRGFLLALRDSCEAKGGEYGVPAYLAEELGKRAGLDLAAIQGARINRRVQELIRELKSSQEAGDRAHAAAEISKIGPLAKVAVPALTEALKDEDSDARSAAAYALGTIGPAAQSAVPALAEAIRVYDRDLLPGAAFALGRVGLAAVSTLTEALSSYDPDVRSCAAVALGSVGPEAVPAIMNALQNNNDPDVRSTAASALGEIGPAAQSAMPALAGALKDTNPDVRSAAADALRRIEEATKPPDAISATD